MDLLIGLGIYALIAAIILIVEGARGEDLPSASFLAAAWVVVLLIAATAYSAHGLHSLGKLLRRKFNR